jgi:hypothetical protein
VKDCQLLRKEFVSIEFVVSVVDWHENGSPVLAGTSNEGGMQNFK